MVAGGVLAVLDVDRVVGHLLHAAAHQPAVALLRGHALDFRLLRVEVVGDRVHLVGGRPFGEFGFGDNILAVERVGLAVGVDHLRIHVDAHVVGLEVAVLVGDVALVVDVDQLVGTPLRAAASSPNRGGACRRRASRAVPRPENRPSAPRASRPAPKRANPSPPAAVR